MSNKTVPFVDFFHTLELTGQFYFENIKLDEYTVVQRDVPIGYDFNFDVSLYYMILQRKSDLAYFKLNYACSEYTRWLPNTIDSAEEVFPIEKKIIVYE